jgi:hypothetical protein
LYLCFFLVHGRGFNPIIIVFYIVTPLKILHPLLNFNPMRQTLNNNSARWSSTRERLDDIGMKIKREPDATGIAASASTAPAENPVPRRLGFGGALNTVTPCAACKLLRRRCAQECPFAPYFSPHEPHKFAAVHKVFGASNVSKMLLVLSSHNITIFFL